MSVVTLHTVQSQASSHGDAATSMEIPAGTTLEYLDSRMQHGDRVWEFVTTIHGRRVYCISHRNPV